MIPKLTTDVAELELSRERFAKYPEYLPRIVETNSRVLGTRVVGLMRKEVEPVKFKGTLSRSINFEYDPARFELEIGPTAKHALYVYHGTVPHWAPIEPLKEWARWKLGDENAAYAVRWSIAKHGTSRWAAKKYGTSGENPFLERLVARGDFKKAMENTARRLGSDLGASITGVSDLQTRIQRTQGYGI